jgi:hypothetical protein
MVSLGAWLMTLAGNTVYPCGSIDANFDRWTVHLKDLNYFKEKTFYLKLGSKHAKNNQHT